MDFKALNLNEFGLDANSPISRSQNIIGMDFDTELEVQTRRVKVSRLVGISGTAVASSTIGSGVTAVVTTILNPINKNQGRNHAVPYLAIYEGTSAVGSMAIYPGIGSGITGDRWHIYSGFDYASYNGTNSVYKVSLYNNTGSAVPIYAITQWKLVQDNAGISS